MFKKTMLFAAALALIVQLAGCACSGTTAPMSTPSIAPAATPSAEVIETSPDAILSPDAQQSPDAQSGSGGNDAAGGTTGGAAGGTTGGTGGATGGSTTGGGTGGAGTGSIENFKEGTEVQESDVPEIASAVKAKYENAKIESIKHAMRENKQVYEIKLASGSTTQTVYVQPDGTVME